MSDLSLRTTSRKIQKLNNEINGDKFQDIKIIQQALKKKNCTNLLPLFS